jgi:hypothetical protein
MSALKLLITNNLYDLKKKFLKKSLSDQRNESTRIKDSETIFLEKIKSSR